MTTKMKDSGIEWIGEIPEEWEVKRVKYCCDTLGSGTTPESNNIDYYNGEFNWIQSGDLYKRDTIHITDKTITQLALSTYSTLKIYCADFVVIAMYGASVGNVAISKINACVNQACCVLTQGKNNEVRFIYYWLVHCKDDLIQKSLGGGQPNISQQTIKNETMLSLSLHEQTLIANYLDEQCGKIDSITADIEKQIEVLEEYKKSLITETVTKGLDKTVPMKDSGIEWIGEIPEEWEVTPLKYISICNKDVLSENTNPSLTFNYVDIGSVTYEKGIQEFQEIKFEDSPSRARRIVCLGDTLISTVRTYLKAIAYVDETSNFIASTGFAVISASQRLFPKYLYYFCKSEGFIQEVDKYSYGIAYPSINTELLLKIKVSYSEYKEQTLIANYLDEKCSQIDAIISSKKEQLNKISEHRKSLIYEYVTGKKRVKGVHQHGN